MTLGFHSWPLRISNWNRGGYSPGTMRPAGGPAGPLALAMKSLVAHVSLDDDLVAAGGLHSLGAANPRSGLVPAPDLKAAFEKHRGQTEGHIERLQQVLEAMGKRPQGKTCEAIEGIIAEGEEMEEFKDTPALAAGLISSAQAVEHYEITRYGTLKRWAETLGMNDAVKSLDVTLNEESQTDEDLTKLAEGSANQKAAA